MPRYKREQYDQTKMIPIAFDQQLVPGTFEHALAYIVDHELDLSCFDGQYNNDETGREAYHPGTLLKVVLLAYSRGITSSRRIEQLCRENVVFMAISSDTQPHFTTIADFVSRSPDQMAELFVQVVMICDEQGLIGKEMFAVDGCKIPSNAGKQWSGTHAELRNKARKLDNAARKIVARHRRDDDNDDPPTGGSARAQQQVQKLRSSSEKIKSFLASNDKRMGRTPRNRKGKEIKSNVTDNESVKMHTSHGTIQGFIGVAAVDSEHQVVVEASAYGQSQEHGLLEPSIDNAYAHLKFTEKQKRTTKISADSGYNNETSLDYLEANGIDGYIADSQYRKRDVRFETSNRHKKKKLPKKKPNQYTVDDFDIDIKNKTCVCPAGKSMWLQADRTSHSNTAYLRFRGYEVDCRECDQRKQCLRREDQPQPRQVMKSLGSGPKANERSIDRMRDKIDTEQGRHEYSRRMGIVEPVFGHITHAIGIKRFSLRGRRKVDGQWKLMAMVVNLTKLSKYGAMAT